MTKPIERGARHADATEPELIAPMPSALSLYGRALGSLHKTRRHRGSWSSHGDTQASATPLPALAIARTGVMLDAAHIDRYRRVCGFIPAQGVPLTYPHILAFPLHLLLMTDARFPWPALGLVHLANTITQHAALAPGDTLRIEAQIGAPLAHDKGQAFTFHTRVYREDSDDRNDCDSSEDSDNSDDSPADEKPGGVHQRPGPTAGGTRSLESPRERRLVWDAASVYLRIGVANPAGAPALKPAYPDVPFVRRASWQLDAGLGRRYAAVSGDFNPIHLSALSARLFGFRRALVHGMWTKARALAALLPPHPLEAASAAVEFKLPLWLPGDATLWTADDAATAFEVRDTAGEKPHLRGRIAIAR
jgi:acyl dehydratase